MTLRTALHRVAARVVAMILRPGATFDAANFRLWERHGYHITPVHYYYPIPDTRELKQRPQAQSSLPGIDLGVERQLELLERAFARYALEYNALAEHAADAASFGLDNDAFAGIDPLVYYCMIRHFQPRRIVEIGSGHSTLLGAQAARRNEATRYTCIDPWPRDFIAGGVPGVEIVRRKVEDVDPSLFLELAENDILFIDSSHVVRTGGDVCFLFLEILPRLAPGVVVHVHDVFLPLDYPTTWLVDRQWFWTEQYLLQAFLIDNDRTRVLMACHFLCRTYPDRVATAFPSARVVDGGSFWMQRCSPGDLLRSRGGTH